MFVLHADKNKLSVREREPVTSGSVNVYKVQFEFSPDWNGMERVAVFTAGRKSVSVLLDENGCCTIPWEVLYQPKVKLFCGVYGKKGGTMVLPTVYADLDWILTGVEPGSTSRPATPDLWQQELARKADGLKYDGFTLSLLSGDKPLAEVQITGGGGEGGGREYQFGHGLKVTGNTVSVNAVDDFKGDNTLPMTAAGVQATVGNIEALLGTI